MFESLSERLGGVFDRLTKAGALTEADVVTALREVRVALLNGLMLGAILGSIVLAWFHNPGLSVVIFVAGKDEHGEDV